MSTLLERWLRYQILGERLRAPRRKKSGRGPYRCYRYRAWIRSLPSAVSGLYGCEAAHTGLDGGMGQKSSDLSCIPLTGLEHREFHQVGRRAFEQWYGISCAAVVRRLNRIWFELGGMVK